MPLLPQHSKWVSSKEEERFRAFWAFCCWWVFLFVCLGCFVLKTQEKQTLFWARQLLPHQPAGTCSLSPVCACPQVMVLTVWGGSCILCVATRAFSSASQLPLASSSLLFLFAYFFSSTLLLWSSSALVFTWLTDARFVRLSAQPASGSPWYPAHRVGVKVLVLAHRQEKNV